VLVVGVPLLFLGVAVVGILAFIGVGDTSDEGARKLMARHSMNETFEQMVYSSDAVGAFLRQSHEIPVPIYHIERGADGKEIYTRTGETVRVPGDMQWIEWETFFKKGLPRSDLEVVLKPGVEKVHDMMGRRSSSGRRAFQQFFQPTWNLKLSLMF
jgi:hypothetical protein